MANAWTVLRTAVGNFIANEALSRGAAIAFYTVTSLAPVLLIAIGVAGLVFGQEAAQDRIVGELRELMGAQSAELIQTMIASARDQTSGAAVTVFGLLMVALTASGIFGEMQAGLNKTWAVKPPALPLAALVRTRAASSGPRRRAWFPACRLACRKRWPVGVRHVSRGGLPARGAAPVTPQYSRFNPPVRPAVCCHLQGVARCADCVARRADRGGAHGTAVYGG